MPATATIVLAGVTLDPQGLPLTPHQDLAADTRISIVPSGAKTFAAGHSLQMETDLIGARWKTMVFTNGIPGDQESGTGSVMYINGLVLSFPTNNDVALEVKVAGTVPEGPSEATVLRVRELDNSGVPVAGSEITITEPVSVPAAPVTTGVQATTPPLPSTSPSPTSAGGCLLPVALLAAGGAAVACRQTRGKSP